jgi:hypothetical protein
MPWVPRYSKEEAAEAIARSRSWADALRFLGLAPRGKNFSTLRKWAEIWGLEVDHLPPSQSRGSAPRFTEAQARVAIASSCSWTKALRRLGYCPTGGNPTTLKKWAERWGISTQHFDPRAASIAGLRRANRRRPLEEVLVEKSTFSRSHLKQRLYEERLKEPKCELCGQGESWRGKRLSMILDHINGIRNDNRLENLRIVCPNCAATLDTHCGRKLRSIPDLRACLRCGTEFRPRYRRQRYCSRECGTRWDRTGIPSPATRRVERPPYEQLLAEVKRLGFLAVGRKHGVSDNAIRKWVRFYESELARLDAEGEPLDEAA